MPGLLRCADPGGVSVTRPDRTMYAAVGVLAVLVLVLVGVTIVYVASGR